MPDDPVNEVAEMMSVPMEELLTSLGRGVGAAQAALDRHSIEIQQLIDSDPVLGQYGLQASWYQIPSTQLELKIAIAMQQPATPAPTPGVVPEASGFLSDLPLARPLPRLWVNPVNARYANQFGFNTTASSTVSLTIVPVPPPAAVTVARPTHTEAEVLVVVHDHLLTADSQVRGRVSLNFNPAARSWFILQTEETATVPALIKRIRVDDDTLVITLEEPVGG